MNQPLPPGQRDIASFPRFGLTQFAHRFPKDISRIELDVTGNVEHQLHLPDALNGLPRVEQVSDFHCVTTWSCRSLRWGGVRFADFYERVVVPKACPHPPQFRNRSIPSANNEARGHIAAYSLIHLSASFSRHLSRHGGCHRLSGFQQLNGGHNGLPPYHRPAQSQRGITEAFQTAECD